jgi:branched-subunit amino acid permease
MTVDTSSADDSTVGAGAEIHPIEAAVSAGELVLASRFGSAITLVEPEVLAVLAASHPGDQALPRAAGAR